MTARPATRPRKPTEKPAIDRDRAVLDATIRLLGRGGLGTVTHRAVAAEAGVSLGAVTYRYASIDALLEAALLHLCALELAELQALALELQTRAFDLDAWAAAFAKTMAGSLRREREAELAGFELFLDAARHPRLRKASQQGHEAYVGLAALVLRAAGSKEPDRHARILVSAVVGIELEQLANPRPRFEAELAAALRDLVVGLVCSTRESAR